MRTILRDPVGYGKNLQRITWPDYERIAISIVINYKEGSEATPLDEDGKHETLGEIHSNKSPDSSDLMNDSQWKYEALAGVWQL